MSGARSQRPPPLLCFLFLPATIARLVSPSPAALPSFLPARAAEIREPEAVEAMSRMRMLPVVVDTANLCATVGTCFYEIPARSPTPRERFDGLDVQLSQRMAQARLVQSQLRPPAASAAGATMPVLCLHGADASSLEWRRALPRLARLGLTGAAVDWWSGGFTDRRPILTRLGAAPAADKRPYPADQPASRAAPSTEQPLQPWTLVRDHLHAFCRQRYGDQPIILVGASLGGAVALDFACAHPDAVGGLVLCDAGGESYASPPAPVVAALAPAVAGAKVLLELAGRGVLSASWAGAVGQGEPPMYPRHPRGAFREERIRQGEFQAKPRIGRVGRADTLTLSSNAVFPPFPHPLPTPRFRCRGRAPDQLCAPRRPRLGRGAGQLLCVRGLPGARGPAADSARAAAVPRRVGERRPGSAHARRICVRAGPAGVRGGAAGAWCRTHAAAGRPGRRRAPHRAVRARARGVG